MLGSYPTTLTDKVVQTEEAPTLAEMLEQECPTSSCKGEQKFRYVGVEEGTLVYQCLTCSNAYLLKTLNKYVEDRLKNKADKNGI